MIVLIAIICSGWSSGFAAAGQETDDTKNPPQTPTLLILNDGTLVFPGQVSIVQSISTAMVSSAPGLQPGDGLMAGRFQPLQRLSGGGEKPLKRLGRARSFPTGLKPRC
jgi:hypothetical protein